MGCILKEEEKHDSFQFELTKAPKSLLRWWSLTFSCFGVVGGVESSPKRYSVPDLSCCMTASVVPRAKRWMGKDNCECRLGKSPSSAPRPRLAPGISPANRQRGPTAHWLFARGQVEETPGCGKREDAATDHNHQGTNMDEETRRTQRRRLQISFPLSCSTASATAGPAYLRGVDIGECARMCAALNCTGYVCGVKLSWGVRKKTVKKTKGN